VTNALTREREDGNSHDLFARGAWRSVAVTRCGGSRKVDSETDRQTDRLPPAGT
jgi:hypothetical protein